MFKQTSISVAALIALGVVAMPSMAQEQAQQLERVEITGSSIKRIASESALPVQIITATEIAKTGYTSVTELIQNLPAMQGFTTGPQSVNGGGGGGTTASLHALGESYTLVLLNGRRVAPLNTGSTVNLSAIPLAAIERVEVLTDGASALYGSDAIAGVVNFITKKDSADGAINASYYAPQHPGGGSAAVSITKGFGDLAKDKFNVLLAASYDKQKALFASRRDFSKTGILTFQDLGQQQSANLLSSNSVPGNVTSAILSDGSEVRSFNPYLLKTGVCPAGQVQSGKLCLFDYSATVESIPASERGSLYGSGRLQVSDKVSAFTELLVSRFYNDPIYAAPAQQGLPINAALLAKDVNPYLATLGKPGLTAVSGLMNLRVSDAGGRQDRYQTDTTHFVIGADASFGNWDTTTYFTHSENKFKDKAMGGYSSLIAFNNLVASGTWDPLMDVAGSKASTLAPIVLHQLVDQSKSSLDILSIRGSSTVGRLPGGEVGLGLGADFTRQKYSDSPSAIYMGNNALQPDYHDAIIGGGGGALPFKSSRNSYGLFSEVQLPVTKQFEVDGSVRYDSYATVKNSENFDLDGNPLPSATQGKSNASATYKIGLRFQPMKELLLRASAGTGFKVPTLGNVTTPLSSGGVTGMKACPPNLPAALASACVNHPYEYNVQSGGNPSSAADALRPEKSRQWTLGFRFEPDGSMSLGADLWTVRLKDQIDSIKEDVAFGNGALYSNLFKVAPDPVTGTPTLTFIAQPINTGKANYQGIDIDAQGRFATPLGQLTTRAQATYVIRADYQLPGVTGYLNSINKIGVDTQVTFRYLVNLSATLDAGAFSHTLALNFKPSYMDDTLNYCRSDDAGDCLKTAQGDDQGRYVKSYTLVDWQTKYNYSTAAAITLGIKNLFDAKPPFSLINQQGTPNARGFDGRYTDPIGRQFYLSGSYKF